MLEVRGFIFKYNNFESIYFYFWKVYADGYVPREVEFVVIDDHPTLLNVTLRPAKVWFDILGCRNFKNNLK